MQIWITVHPIAANKHCCEGTQSRSAPSHAYPRVRCRITKSSKEQVHGYAPQAFVREPSNEGIRSAATLPLVPSFDGECQVLIGEGIDIA